MKILPILFGLVFALQILVPINEAKKGLTDGFNGGSVCFMCTALVGITEQLAIVYNSTVEESVEKLCNFLPEGIFRITCKDAVIEFGPIFISGIYKKETPDVICHALGLCKTDKGRKECSLFPKPKNSIKDRSHILKTDLKLKGIQVDSENGGSEICNKPIFKQLCAYINKIFNNHEPAADKDHDGFGISETLRGTSWRGKDCNDLSHKTRPGRIPTYGDLLEDTNCNGIFGKDPTTGESYEDKFCKNSGQMGIALLGESMGAHYHIPEQWLDANQISAVAFQHLAFILENEMGWPQLSYSTGHLTNSWPVVSGPTKSLYLNMWERNRCNFRDYQNLAVNGADTTKILRNMKFLNRSQLEDQPLILGYSAVGDDVCNGEEDTLSHMTPPDVFYSNIVEGLEYLDTILPKGSHIFLTGLANGSVLYELVGERIHPIGRVKNDVKYKDFYSYMNCLGISPCNGWMTTNATLRQLTTDYSVMLSGIAKNISESFTYKNFDVFYIDFPSDPVFKTWESMGGEDWQLIEAVDGFHMNQIANSLLADELWSILSKNKPDWLGPVNPNNDQIAKLFGDQGGY